jgi:hypothetical protein
MSDTCTDCKQPFGSGGSTSYGDEVDGEQVYRCKDCAGIDLWLKWTDASKERDDALARVKELEATVLHQDGEEITREARIVGLEQAKDGAYAERNACVAVIARLALDRGWSVGLSDHDGPGPLDPDWLNVVVIDLPTGQVSWHFHKNELPLFSWLPRYSGTWDGHSTAEKYARCDALAKGKA